MDVHISGVSRIFRRGVLKSIPIIPVHLISFAHVIIALLLSTVCLFVLFCYNLFISAAPTFGCSRQCCKALVQLQLQLQYNNVALEDS